MCPSFMEQKYFAIFSQQNKLKTRNLKLKKQNIYFYNNLENMLQMQIVIYEQ